MRRRDLIGLIGAGWLIPPHIGVAQVTVTVNRCRSGTTLARSDATLHGRFYRGYAGTRTDRGSGL